MNWPSLRFSKADISNISSEEGLTLEKSAEDLFIVSNLHQIIFVNGIREMVIFDLGKEIEEDVFRLVASVGQRKNLSPHEESNLRPSGGAIDIANPDSI